MPVSSFSPNKIRRYFQQGYSAPLILERKFSLSPWEFYRRVHGESPQSFFLDSLAYHPPAQRYSYVGWRPYLSVTYETLGCNAAIRHCEEAEGRRSNLRPKIASPQSRVIQHGIGARNDWEGSSLLTEMRKIFKRVKPAPGLSFDFFSGGAVGFWSYELAREFDRISFRKKPGPSIPDLGLLFFRDLVVYDHRLERYQLISWLVPGKGLSFAKAFDRAQENLKEMELAFSLPDPLLSNGEFHLARFRPEISRAGFERMVRKALDYIHAGDIYQANLSQRFSFEYQGSPLRLYGRLRERNPSPFSAAFQWGDLFIASSSPELLFAKRGRDCVTCPIAGTRPRGRSAEESRRLARELFQSEKERAEHLMLVDLERNDLGRVSEWRSVRVKDFMRLEKYARVQHIVSEISGRLRPGKDAWDVIAAMFPGGTITGCPKIRSMEIIDELEPVRRGIYTGSLGYVGFNGDAMLNIAIRTLVLEKNRGHLQVGAGIVADSDPAREYDETLAKGEALAEALLSASTRDY